MLLLDGASVNTILLEFCAGSLPLQSVTESTPTVWPPAILAKLPSAPVLDTQTPRRVRSGLPPLKPTSTFPPEVTATSVCPFSEVAPTVLPITAWKLVPPSVERITLLWQAT